MGFNVCRLLLAASLLTSLAMRIVATASVARAPSSAPKIWDDTALADWATPIAALKQRPAHYTAAEYYAVPADNLRTYPVYLPDKEPPGYWASLQKKKPEPLVDVSKIRTKYDWIEAGARAFRELDNPFSRTDDPALIAAIRDPNTFAGIGGLADGTVLDQRWVVTERGVMLTQWECAACHAKMAPDRTIAYGEPLSERPAGAAPAGVERFLVRLLALAAERQYGTADPVALFPRMFSVPWAPDETARLQRFLTNAQAAASVGFNPHGVIPRINGSPFYGTRVPDLHLLRYSKYLDATATHRLRGPEDIARYAALINSADPVDFGTHRFLSDSQRRVRYRFADEVLYAIGVYLVSLEPPENPSPPPVDLVARGRAIFRREKCASCHPAPAYTTGELTPAAGFDPPLDHPNFADVRDRSVGTDPGLALKTRKGTGFYKIPSLRGLWYRPRLLHDASIVSLEELFDAARLSPDYERRGWSAPGAINGATPGLEFLTKLTPEEKTALIAFLRSL
jgi:hypothetical protein